MPSFYKVLEHVSDAYIEVRGSSMEECFSKAGLAVVDLMVDLNLICEMSSFVYRAQGFDLESLLYNFLEEVLLKATSGEFLACSLEVEICKSGDVFNIRGVGRGEPLSVDRHRPKLEVKAVTYHLMEIKKMDREFVIRFVLDL
ncbi:MAG: archease [Nitrososphaeria archaeon]